MRRQILENVVSLREILTEGLNDAQIQAVTHGEGPALILAGPGSGKTVTIVKRILYLIQIKHISPEEILVVTFTKDAALSMQRRFAEQTESMCGQTAQDGYPMRQTYAVNFGTFHSVFYQILRMSGACKDHAIPTLTQKRNILMSVLKYSSNGEDLKAQADRYLAAIGYYKNTQNAERAKRLLSAGEREGFSAVLDAYQRKCRESGLLDFDDMVYECLRLLKKDAVLLASLRRRFRYLLVDEFQDINNIQARIIKVLAATAETLVVVGDDYQSIYGFRGSNPEVFINFENDYPNVKVVTLSSNYRSDQSVLDLANCVMDTKYDDANSGVFNVDRAMIAANGVTGVKPELIKCKDSVEEKVDVFARIQEDLANHSSVGVLYRQSTSSYGLEVDLQKAGISFNKFGGVKFLEKTVVQDIMAFYKLIYNPFDFLSIYRICEIYPNINAVRASKIADVTKTQGFAGLCNTQFASQHNPTSQDIHAHLVKLAEWLNWLSSVAMTHDNEDLINVTFDQTVDYYKICREEFISRSRIDEDKRSDQLDELRAEIEDVRYALKELLSVNTKEFVLSSGLATIKEDKEELLTLSTIHSAKGLEWDIVYILDTVTETMSKEEEDDLRCFYVAITRARNKLVMYQPKTITQYGKMIDTTALDWLSEAKSYMNISRI